MRFVNYHHITIIAAIVIIASGYAVSSDVNVVDVIANIVFTPILDAAYAVHGALLSLNATSSIADDDDDDRALGGAWGITTFVVRRPHLRCRYSIFMITASRSSTSPTRPTSPPQAKLMMTSGEPSSLWVCRGITTFTYQAAIPTPQLQDMVSSGVQILNITNPSNVTAAGKIDDIRGAVNLAKSAWGITTFVVRRPAPTPQLQHMGITASRSSTSPTRSNIIRRRSASPIA